jgi:hypothetical protein
MDSRIWIAKHERFSADVANKLSGSFASLGARARDPMPIVGRALALMLAVSLSSLSLGAAIA